MAKKIKVSRKELLKEPDQFLSSSEKAMVFFHNNRSAVIGSIVAVVVGGLSLFGYQNYQYSQVMKYEALYFNMENIAAKEAGNNPQAELIKIRDQFSKGPHRNRASLLLADIYFQRNEFDKAQATYLEIINDSPVKDLNYQMANAGLAYTYEAKGDYQNAIDLFKSIIETHGKFPVFQVYWSMARCYESKNDTSNALLILREMQIKFSGSVQAEKIENRIKQLST